MVLFWAFIRNNILVIIISRPLVNWPLLGFYKIIYSLGKQGSPWSLAAFIVSLIIYLLIVWNISKIFNAIRRAYRRARGKEEAKELEEDTESAKRVIKAFNKGAKKGGGFEIE